MERRKFYTPHLDRNYNKYSLEEEFSTPLQFKTFYPYSTCPTIILWKEEDSTPLLQKNYRSIYRLTFSCTRIFYTPILPELNHISVEEFLPGRRNLLTEKSTPRKSVHCSEFPTTYIYSVNNAESSHWSESTTYVTLSKVKSQDTQVSKSSRQPRSNKLKNQNHRSEELTTPKLPLVTTHHLN